MSIVGTEAIAKIANTNDNATVTTTTITIEQKLQKKPEQWEIDKIGEFLLELYLKQIISYRRNWLVEKHRARTEFEKFLLAQEDSQTLRAKFQESNGTSNIGTILQRTNYLRNTERGSPYYCIKKISLFEFRNRRFAELDAKQKCSSVTLKDEGQQGYEHQNNSSNKAIKAIKSDTGTLYVDKTLYSTFEVLKDAEIFKLQYEGTDLQKINSKFLQTNMGCFICQKNFSTPQDFESHAEFHGVEGDFEYAKELTKRDEPYLNLYYQHCKSSHYFCFSLENISENDFILEKIIIVLPTSMYEIHNSFLPTDLPSHKSYKFFADSHLFQKFVEQPILIAFRSNGETNARLVEEHHFMRLQDFPVMHISINSNFLPSKLLFKQVFKLAQYKPTQELRQALKNPYPIQSLVNLSNDFKNYFENEKHLTMQNVRETLNILLQIEDMDTINQYASLLQRNVKLRSHEGGYSLRLQVKDNINPEHILSPYDEIIIVPQSSEKLIINQNQNALELIMKNMDDIEHELKKYKKSKSCYFGQVESISHRRVQFRCDKAINDENLLVIFCPGRLPMRYQYRALELFRDMKPYDVGRILFPNVPAKIICEQPKTNLMLLDSNILNNPEQLHAVQAIAYGPRKEAPHIIFGPPGTGKTTTLVEAILQLYFRRADTKILVTAGSNSACDELALRLITKLKTLNEPRAITRIYSRSAEKSDCIDERLLDASNMYSAHFYPSVNVLHEFRIVVCTLSVIGKLSTGKFGKTELGEGIYTHIFVDEAGASTEAETLVAVMSIMTSKSYLILSGDHKQLGAVMSSTRAAELGLSVSMMERLLTRDCYRVNADGSYDTSIQTRLRRNYRSHPEIVKLFSRLYYNNELLALADAPELELCGRWHAMPNPDFPIMFHSVFGKTERELNSPSCCNFAELQVVLDYVKELLYFGINGEKIEQEDIGIISPYKKQYQLIQDELNMRNWHAVETGSVEKFQGKEKRIIIVSFVRSFTSTLGFLENPRRLNVTISRPKALLILVGNPKTLSLNPDYKYIIDLCKRNNSMSGCTIREDGELRRNSNGSSQDLNRSMEKLSLRNNGNKNNEQMNNLNGNNLRQQHKARNKQNSNSERTKTDETTTSANNPNSLSQTMKKNTQTKNKQKQRKNMQKFKNYKEKAKENGLKADSDASSTSTLANESKSKKKTAANSTIDLDELFNSLPKVPVDKPNKDAASKQPKSYASRYPYVQRTSVFQCATAEEAVNKTIEQQINESVRATLSTPLKSVARNATTTRMQQKSQSPTEQLIQSALKSTPPISAAAANSIDQYFFNDMIYASTSAAVRPTGTCAKISLPTKSLASSSTSTSNSQNVCNLQSQRNSCIFNNLSHLSNQSVVTSVPVNHVVRSVASSSNTTTFSASSIRPRPRPSSSSKAASVASQPLQSHIKTTTSFVSSVSSIKPLTVSTSRTLNNSSLYPNLNSLSSSTVSNRPISVTTTSGTAAEYNNIQSNYPRVSAMRTTTTATTTSAAASAASNHVREFSASTFPSNDIPECTYERPKKKSSKCVIS